MNAVDSFRSAFRHKLYWSALALFSVAASWGAISVLNEGYHAAQLRTVQALTSPHAIESPAETKPGEIVIVTGLLSVSDMSLPPDEPAFRNASRVEKVVEQGDGPGKWKVDNRTVWLPANAWVGDFAIDRQMLKEPQFDTIYMNPGTDFLIPAWPQFADVSISGNMIEYTSGTDKKRAYYLVWPSGIKVFVLAKVDATGKKLVPFSIKNLGPSFWVMRNAAETGDTFLADEISHNVTAGAAYLALFAFSSFGFWCCILAQERKRSEQRVWGRAICPPVVCSVPLLGYFIWPMTSADYAIAMPITLVLFIIAAVVIGSLTWISR